MSSKYVTAAEAVKVVQSNQRVYVQAAAATPTVLTKALSERAAELRNVEICHLHTEGEAPYANPDLAESFHVNSFFIGKNVRHTLAAGNGSYTPVFLSELASFVQEKSTAFGCCFYSCFSARPSRILLAWGICRSDSGGNRKCQNCYCSGES